LIDNFNISECVVDYAARCRFCHRDVHAGQHCVQLLSGQKDNENLSGLPAAQRHVHRQGGKSYQETDAYTILLSLLCGCALE
jgi:hypothetical protein